MEQNPRIEKGGYAAQDGFRASFTGETRSGPSLGTVNPPRHDSTTELAPSPR